MDCFEPASSTSFTTDVSTITSVPTTTIIPTTTVPTTTNVPTTTVPTTTTLEQTTTQIVSTTSVESSTSGLSYVTFQPQAGFFDKVLNLQLIFQFKQNVILHINADGFHINAD